MSVTAKVHDLTPEWRDRLDKTIASFEKAPKDPDSIYYLDFLDDEPEKKLVTRRFNWLTRPEPCPVPETIQQEVSNTTISCYFESVEDLIDALQGSKPDLYTVSEVRLKEDELTVRYMVEHPESEDSFQERLARWHLNRAFLAEWNRVELQRKKEEALDRANQLEKEARELRKKFT